MIPAELVKQGKRQMCLRCVGQGHLSNSELIHHGPSQSYIRTSPTNCPDCRGKGLVLVLPIPDEEELSGA